MCKDMISIVIPAYNAEKTIQRTLESVINQTYKNIEVIVVNDGSNDCTQSIIEKYESENSIIHVINQVNSGVSCARNTGLRKANGDFILFVDSDDALELNACEKMLCAYDNDTELVVCGLRIIQEERVLRTPHLTDQIIDLKKSIDKYWELRQINLGPCNKLYRKELIKTSFEEGLSFGEDTKFVIDYLRNINKISIISDCLYNVYLDNENSLNHSTKSNKLPQLLKVRNYEEEFLNQYYPGNSDSRIHQRFFLDLHVVVTSIIKENNKKDAIRFINDKLKSFDYGYHLSDSKFNRLYYKLFSFFVAHRNSKSLYYLVWMRIKMGAL